MKHEKFLDNNNNTIIVITDWGDKKKSKEEAIRYAANKIFKVRKEFLKTVDCYMTNADDDMIYFHTKTGTHKFIGVCRKTAF